MGKVLATDINMFGHSWIPLTNAFTSSNWSTAGNVLKTDASFSEIPADSLIAVEWDGTGISNMGMGSTDTLITFDYWHVNDGDSSIVFQLNFGPVTLPNSSTALRRFFVRYSIKESGGNLVVGTCWRYDLYIRSSTTAWTITSRSTGYCYPRMIYQLISK